MRGAGLAAVIWAVGIWAVFVGGSGFCGAADWPTMGHDVHRSGMTEEALAAEALGLAWVHEPAQLPDPAWPGPAKWDAYSGVRGLRSMRNYDPAFHVIAVGGRVYYGSSADDSVHALEAATGERVWSFTTGGPVRVPPTWVEGVLYFGSDDGFAYAVDAETGEERWRYRPGPRIRTDDASRRILHNGRMISKWPVRTGVMVVEGTAYFGAGLLPWEASYLCAVDAETGKATNDAHYVKALATVTMEGAMLSSRDEIFVPQGRVPPRVYRRSNGEALGALSGGGGCFVLLTEDEHVLHGPGNKRGWITDSKAGSRTKVATYDGGNAMLVRGDMAYLLTDHRLAAINRGERNRVWDVACDLPHAMILAGETLYVGGTDGVAAYDAESGEIVWRESVVGKAFGLAVAEGQLLVSTDMGKVYAFRAGASAEVKERVAQRGGDAVDEEFEVAGIETVEEAGLLSRWVFGRSAMTPRMVADQTGRAHAAIAGRAELTRIGELEALELDGSTTTVQVPGDARAKLPRRAMTASAWVKVDRPQPWGAMVGAVQDDGAVERGWFMGFRDAEFCFALHGAEGAAGLAYAQAETGFVPGSWHHVAGTYDGAEMKVYVDGVLAGQSNEAAGDIEYPEKIFYELGAYHDQNEHFRVAGMLYEVRVYERTLEAEEIARQASGVTFAETEFVKPALDPYLQFTGKGRAVVRWETAEESPSVLEYALDGVVRRIVDEEKKTRHEVRLAGLLKDRVYLYRVEFLDGGELKSTEDYECDTHFDYSVADAEAEVRGEDAWTKVYEGAAARILETAGVQRGVCVVLGCGAGWLAEAIATRSGMRVVGVDTDGEAIARGRERLLAAGMYGNRVALVEVNSLADLPLVGDFADVVVSEGMLRRGVCEGTAEEAVRILQPGGVAVFGQSSDAVAAEAVAADAAEADGAKRLTRERLAAWLGGAVEDVEVKDDAEGVWAVHRRGAIEGGGVWSHQYGTADNSAYGEEQLAGARKADDLEVQWLGLPGPRAQPDRQGRKPAPLSVGGRMFVQGLQRIAALDIYNGTVLWSLEIPALARFNVPRDASNWCADEAFLYLAIDERLWQIDAETGEVVRFHKVTEIADAAASDAPSDVVYDWGYVARAEGRVFGSAVRRGAMFTKFWGGEGWYDATSGELTDKVCSDALFAVDRTTGGADWTYRGGLIVNSTITVGEGRVYFVESRNAEATAGSSRRLGTEAFWEDQYLVAVDAATGVMEWEQPLEVVNGVVTLYLAYGDGRLVMVSSAANKYHVYTFAAATGDAAWETDFDWTKDNHGAHMSRPAIVQGRVYVRPAAFDLASGELLPVQMPLGGCGTYAATDDVLFFRSGNVSMWDQETGEKTDWVRLRPDCWLSTIPAGGMLLSPEGGGGCSCGSWMETSLGFFPRASRAESAGR